MPTAEPILRAIFITSGLLIAGLNCVFFLIVRCSTEQFVRPARREDARTFYLILSMLFFVDMVFGFAFFIKQMTLIGKLQNMNFLKTQS